MNPVSPPFLLHTLHWFLLLGAFLILVSGLFALVSSRGWTGLLLPAGSVPILWVGGVLFGIWPVPAVDVSKLLNTISLCLIGLVIGAFVANTLAWMLKRLSD